jgi:hypothetical protein
MSNNCPPPQPLTEAEQQDRIGAILRSFGATSCYNDSGSQMEFSSDSVLGGLVYSGESMSSENYSTNLGCEQIAALSNVSREFENKVYCTMMDNKNKTSNIVLQTNSIDIVVAGKISCATGIEINAKNTSDMEVISEINAEMKQTIENQLKSTVDQVTDVLQTSETETGANPQGGKSFSDNLSEFNSSQTVQNLMNNVNTIFNEINQTNKLTIRVEKGGEIEVKDGKCILANFENVNKLVAKNVTKSVMDNIFKDLKDRGVVQSAKVEQQSKNTGFATIYDKLAKFMGQNKWITMILIIVFGFIAYKFLGGGGGGGSGGGGGLFGGGSSGGVGGGAGAEEQKKSGRFYILLGILFIVLGSLTVAGKIFTTTKVSQSTSGSYKKSDVQEEKNTTLGIILIVMGIIALFYGIYKYYQGYFFGAVEGITGGSIPGGSVPGGSDAAMVSAIASNPQAVQNLANTGLQVASMLPQGRMLRMGMGMRQ